MKNLLLMLSLLIASSASAGDIDWTNTAGGGTLPIAPPGNDPGFSVGPLVPISFVPPDSEFYAHCGAGYACNFMKSGAENKYRDEAKQKAQVEKAAYQQKLDQETAKIDRDLDALRNGGELSQSPEGQKAQADLKKAQALRESAKAKRAATLQFVKETEGKAAEEFAVKFGLADTKDESDLMATKAKLDLSSGKNYLQQRIDLANKKADSVEATINAQGGEYKEQRLTFAKIGRASLGVAQVRLNENDIRTAQIAYKIGTMALDIGLGFVPGVSTFKDGYEALLGKNLVTGESLSKFDRTVAAVGLITLGLGSTIGRSLKAAEKGAEVFKDVAKAIEGGEDLIKVADDAADAVRAAENFGAKSVKEMENIYVDLASAERRHHILVGEGKNRGGHMFPGNKGSDFNTAFPESWSGDKIMDTVSDIATDPNIKWTNQKGPQGSMFTKKGDAAIWETIVVREEVEIKVILQPAGEGIVTAFPIKGPGVIINGTKP